MRVVFCWQTISGYMASCWKALGSREGIDLHVIAKAPGGAADFDPAIMGGVRHELFSQAQLDDPSLMLPKIVAAEPDVLVTCGWASKSWPAAARYRGLAGVPMIMAMDTPYRGTLRQKLGRLAMRRYLSRIARCFVAGERTRQLALALGIDRSKIRLSTYGFDESAFAPTAATRRPGAPERSFLFVGRYAPAKGLDTLLDAYGMYRSRVEDPWSLICCGKGEFAPQIRAAEGVTDAGFVQPSELPTRLAAASVFVLASHYEPWGVVVAEAAASGMPVVCTDAVGASIDIVRPYTSGLVVPEADAGALSEALAWMHGRPERVHAMGQAAAVFASAYAAPVWAERWHAAIEDVA
ncbi:MAG: glycosyltransferase family 4 protein [Planctomycetota bacterium]